MFAVFTVFMTQSIFLEIARTFQMEVAQARFAFSIASLFYSASFFFLGPAADKFNLPKMAATGQLLLAVAVLCASYAQNFDIFILSMGLTGAGAALVPAAMFPHVTKISPPDKAGMYIGSIVASATLGVVFGRVAMGLMTEAMGWRPSFRIIAIILASLAAVSLFALVEKNSAGRKNNQSLPGLYANSLRLLLNPKILSLLLAGFSLFAGFLGAVTFLTYRLLDPPFNFTSGEIGWISCAGITALVAPFAGNFSQKTGILKILLPGLAACVFSLQLMGWVPSVTLTTIGLLLLFLSVYSCQPLLFIIIGQNVPRESIGSASSLYILFCIGGGSVSSIFLGPVWNSHGWSGIIMVCSALLLAALAMISAFALKERRKAESR